MCIHAMLQKISEKTQRPIVFIKRKNYVKVYRDIL